MWGSTRISRVAASHPITAPYWGHYIYPSLCFSLSTRSISEWRNRSYSAQCFWAFPFSISSSSSSSSFFLLIGENGGVLLHGVRCIGRGGGGTGAEQEQQGPNQHIFRLQFLQEQLPPRIFPHDGYAITSDLSLPFLPLSDREGSRAIAPLLPLDLRTSSVLSLICSFCGFRVRSGRAFLNAFCCCVLFVWFLKFDRMESSVVYYSLMHLIAQKFF